MAFKTRYVFSHKLIFLYSSSITYFLILLSCVVLPFDLQYLNRLKEEFLSSVSNTFIRTNYAETRFVVQLCDIPHLYINSTTVRPPPPFMVTFSFLEKLTAFNLVWPVKSS